MGVVSDLPEMPVGVGEIAVITAPKGLGSRLQDACSGNLRLGEYRIDLGLACDILRRSRHCRPTARQRSRPRSAPSGPIEKALALRRGRSSPRPDFPKPKFS